MAGTKIGGQRAAATNKAKYGEDFYAVQGAKGGRNGNTGGFASRKDIAPIAGKLGGSLSKRGHKYLKTKWGYNYYTLLTTGETVKYKAKG